MWSEITAKLWELNDKNSKKLHVKIMRVLPNIRDTLISIYLRQTRILNAIIFF